MALVRANSMSIIGGRRLAASVFPSSTKALQFREFGSSKEQEPLRKEISFQQYTDEFVKRGKQTCVFPRGIWGWRRSENLSEA